MQKSGKINEWDVLVYMVKASVYKACERWKGQGANFIIGYSFGDKHINSMIFEALELNHSLQLVIVDPFIENLYENYICLFDYLFISSQMSAKPYFIGSTGILLLW